MSIGFSLDANLTFHSSGIQVESEAEDFTAADVGLAGSSSSSSSSSTGHCMQPMCLMSPDNWILGWDSRVSPPLCMTDSLPAELLMIQV